MNVRSRDEHGFALRGLKGLWWEPEQYLGWPELLAEAGYDFFMLCYTFCPETGLRWRQPLGQAEREIIARLAGECATHGIALCLALHPLIGGQAWAPDHAGVRFHPTSGRGWFTRYWEARRPGERMQPDRPIQYGSEADLALLVEKCQQAHALGVDAFALCLDDVDPGSPPAGFGGLAAAHLWLVDGVCAGLRLPAPAHGAVGIKGPHGRPSVGIKGPHGRPSVGIDDVGARHSSHRPADDIAADVRAAQRPHGTAGPESSGLPGRLGGAGGRGAPRLFVVPTYYWTEGARAHPAYTAELARGLPPDVDVFWTGEVVRDHAITAAKAREAATLLGRRPVVWLNYASNDSFRFAIQLPPDQPPSSDLAPETAGLLLNSTRQLGLARLDALIVGAYLSDPVQYDHERAIQMAVVRLVGEAAAPSLMEVVDAWRAVPDVRTMTHDLEAGGRPLLDDLLARLRPALASLDVTMPELDAALADRQLWGELAAGVERLRLLVDALTVLEGELRASGSDAIRPAADATGSPARSALLAELAAAHPEVACDAEAVLTLGPIPSRRVGQASA